MSDTKPRVVTKKRVVIIGAGFGGLFAARTLAGEDVDVFLIDRNNYHTFTPLLYQVATCALDPSDIAYPIRNIFREKQNVHSFLGTLTAVNPQAQTVTIEFAGKSENRALRLFDSGNWQHAHLFWQRRFPSILARTAYLERRR